MSNPERYFNTSGPCNPREHYMLPPERRLGRVMELIGRGRWFVLAAGRQTGKTTSLQWLVEDARTRGEARAVCVDLESAREDPSVATAMRSVLNALDRSL